MRDWLKDLRIQSGLSQKQMGEKLGISESYYCTIESGERQKRMDIMLASSLATLFGISVAEVCEYERKLND